MSFGSIWVKHKQDWGRKFILLLPQSAVRPGSDAGSDGVEPASVSYSKTVRPRALCGVRCMGHANRTWSGIYLVAPHSYFGEVALIYAWTNGIAQHQSPGD